MKDEQNSVNIQVKRGIKVNVQEVDDLEEGRELIADAPSGLKLAIRQSKGGDIGAALNKITMCG